MSYSIKRFFIITAMIIAIVSLIFVIVFLIWKELPGINKGVVAPKTGDLISDTKNKAQEGNGISKEVEFVLATENGSSTEEEKIKAVVVADGSNPINQDTGEVLSRDGQTVVDNSVSDSSDNAPVQSVYVNKEDLPTSVVKITFGADNVSPDNFTVKAGQAVSLAVTATDFVEVFKFEDPSLSAVAVGLVKGGTSVITFNAPEEKGEYVFYSDVPGRKNITGKMIVE